MDEGAKRRLVGAAVLVALAVIFVPMLVDDGGREADPQGDPIYVPESPDFDSAYEGPSATGDDMSNTQLPAPELPTYADDTTPEAFPEWSDELPVPEPPQMPSDDVSVARPAPESAAESATAAATQAPARQAASRAAPEPTPEQPKAKGPKPVPAGASAWVVQVASLGSAESAEQLQDDLRVKGYPAFVEQAVVNGRRYYRVRVGPEVDRSLADRMAAKLEGETGSKPLVQTYR
ncbi:MAG: SPOR domain-containing protein [Thiohalocapsa sp.]|nr:SPOR domain-containing protein [Thiohalocapsa sp.]MCF7992036.1 SPOR domain-containing protein [Thiohalocapsa sp.]